MRCLLLCVPVVACCVLDAVVFGRCCGLLVRVAVCVARCSLCVVVVC